MAKRVSKADMRYTDLQKAFLNMAGRYSAYEIFMDWIEVCALSVANSTCMIHHKYWIDREEKYKSIMNKYDHDEQVKFCEMLAWFVEDIEDNPRDVLGEAFMRSGMGADAAGQFFTPFNISLMMAEVNIESYTDGEISLLEPSCGSGGGIIAMAVALQKKGINYQNVMKVVAQDLDWRCVYMCYLQLSYMGIDAICVQGDTLLDPYREGYPQARVLRTPKNMGVLL